MKQLPKTILCDIDKTIAIPRESDDPEIKYGRAQPITRMIDLLWRAKQKGYRIALYTARGMLTKEGDVVKAMDYAAQPTREWLKRHNVPYDELHWGKPSSCVIVDDLACHPSDFREWLERA